MKTLLLLNNAYWPSIGGIENSLHHLSDEARQRGWLVKIIVSDLGYIGVSSSRWYQEVNDVPVYRYPLKPVGWLGPFNLVLGYFAQKRILLNLYKTHPDALVVSRFHMSVVAARAVGFKSVKYLVPGSMSHQYAVGSSKAQMISSPSLLLKRWLHSAIQARAIKLSEVFVFSELMRKQCCEMVSGQHIDISITKPGVDDRRFHWSSVAEKKALREELGLPSSKCLILFAGRFVHAKGVDVLIESLSFLPSRFDLVLVGEGIAEPQYRCQVLAALMSDRVHIRPPTREVEKFFKCCDVFTMTSTYEPLGQTILEALASGLPVVAFSKKSGVLTATEELGFNEYIKFTNEYTSPSLAAAIRTQVLMTDEKRFLQSERATKAFSWATLLDNLAQPE
jgi:1,2-diacylglycerol 3-alpha-glucosyltransferase